ncbi:Diacylglycerol kinase family enzyme [Granulicella rosea]|uniref:Diacylglycerol kinase family enzyme n=1 Tax=Granulicella rosea TaxID=474952 RepID=A0A239D1B8_9BACT|nr:diacylglycerol kinase family protein [Granulicella rosea]SNS25604.1 Diacylglycerol kinase family enzyme [Granulicella rosea]
MTRRVQVLLNRQSGGENDSSARIAERFALNHMPCEVIEFRAGANAGMLARRAAETPETIVVAAGGDGTVSAIACALAGTGRPLGVLPVGTLNHFAKDLGLPLDLAGAVRVACGESVVEVDAAEVNGLVFINNSSIGFYPAMVTQRERLRRVGWNRWLSLTFATIREFVRFRHVRLRITVDGVERTCATPFLFIGNNEYQMHGAQIGTRQHIDRGQLFLYMAPGASRWDMVRITVAALLGRPPREAPGFERLCVTEAIVDSRRKKTRVSLDGEVRRLKGPLVYKIRPGALRVLCERRP